MIWIIYMLNFDLSSKQNHQNFNKTPAEKVFKVCVYLLQHIIKIIPEYNYIEHENISTWCTDLTDWLYSFICKHIYRCFCLFSIFRCSCYKDNKNILICGSVVFTWKIPGFNQIPGIYNLWKSCSIPDELSLYIRRFMLNSHTVKELKVSNVQS